MPTTAIYNVITVNDAVLTGGQQTAEQLEAVAAEGYTAVINLAPYDPARSLADEAGLARSLGLSDTAARDRAQAMLERAMQRTE